MLNPTVTLKLSPPPPPTHTHTHAQKMFRYTTKVYTYLIDANAVLYAAFPALSYLTRVQSVIWSQLEYDGDREYALLEALEGIIGLNGLCN